MKRSAALVRRVPAHQPPARHRGLDALVSGENGSRFVKVDGAVGQDEGPVRDLQRRARVLLGVGRLACPPQPAATVVPAVS